MSRLNTRGKMDQLVEEIKLVIRRTNNIDISGYKNDFLLRRRIEKVIKEMQSRVNDIYVCYALQQAGETIAEKVAEKIIMRIAWNQDS